MNTGNNQSSLRKRGRPAGKDRVPLSPNERRARNAKYERERRAETNDALADLAAAVGCKSTISHSDLLATVITHLQRASEMKHSSDLESLRRCNKNLMSQIACLEQRLAGTEGDEVPSQPSTELSRPVKRKRDDCGSLEQESAYAPVPVCKYSPVSSPEPKYSPGPSPLPASGPEPCFYPESKYSPTTPEAQQFEPKYSPECESPFPAGLLSTHFLPVPKVSPLSDSSDRQPEDTFDYSAYRFASAQLPTPEYQIASEPPEYAVPETYPGQTFYGDQPLPLQYQSSPEDQFLQPHYMIPDAYSGQHLSGLSLPDDLALPPQLQHAVPVPQYAEPISYPGAASVHPDVVGRSMLPHMGGSGLDPRQVGFLSTEDLISVYLRRS